MHPEALGLQKRLAFLSVPGMTSKQIPVRKGKTVPIMRPPQSITECGGCGPLPCWRQERAEGGCMHTMSVLLTVWALLTAVLAVLLIYRNTLSMHEDDQL